MKKRSGSGRVVLYVFETILCLTLVSTYLVTGIFARYRVSSTGEDAARVAVLDASVDNPITESFAIEVNPGTAAQTVAIHARNDSEVAMRFMVELEETSNIPLIFQAYAPLESDGATAFHYDAEAGAGETELTLGIQWDKTQPSYIYSGGVEMLTVTVRAIQID